MSEKLTKNNYGHKTLIDGTHVPLSKDEAQSIWAAIESARESRAEALPTAVDALRAYGQAEQRMRELGWALAGGLRVKRGDDCAVAQFGSTGMWSGHLDADGRYVHFCDCVADPRKVWLKPLSDLTGDERSLIEECDRREAEAYSSMIGRLASETP